MVIGSSKKTTRKMRWIIIPLLIGLTLLSFNTSQKTLSQVSIELKLAFNALQDTATLQDSNEHYDDDNMTIADEQTAADSDGEEEKEDLEEKVAKEKKTNVNNHNDDDKKNKKKVKSSISHKNLHQALGNFTCGDSITNDAISPVIPALLEMVYGFNPGAYNGVGHIRYSGSILDGAKRLLFLQICSYTLLNRFWELAEKFNIDRWSVHGGGVMGAICHNAINPWDDDIDITVSSCEKLEEIFALGTNVTEKYPEMKVRQHTAAGWEGRLIDDDYILIRGPSNYAKGNWFKLKSVAQIRKKPTRDLGGMDIQCFDERISFYEKRIMESSGYRGACAY